MARIDDRWIQTVKGRVASSELGLWLAHEHLFTDLRGPHVEGYAQGDADDVVRVMKPRLDEAQAAGFTVFVECSTIGVGRNVEVLNRLADNTDIHIIAPTGLYREAYIPTHLLDSSIDELAQMWIADLTAGMDGTNSKAGFIKIAMSDEGITPREVRNLNAAAQASIATGAVIASHTIAGEIAMQEIDILNQTDINMNRFIWVHANIETDMDYHLRAAQSGVYVELDAVGAEWQDQDAMLKYVKNLVDAGHIEQILLSHDAGWYQPGNEGGKPDPAQENGGFRGYTALVETFIPTLLENGLTQVQIDTITQENPVRAYGFS